MKRKGIPTQRELARSILAQAPIGFTNEAMEQAAGRKERSDKGKHQEETKFLHRVLKPFRDAIRYVWQSGDVFLTRNNNGLYKLPSGAFLRYGLGNGTGDGIGWKCITITPDMVGRTIAVFMNVEAKKHSKDKLSDNQQAFDKAVRDAGGISLLIVDEFGDAEAFKAIKEAMP